MENLAIEHLFGGVYKDKTVFITGHTGFKGSWLAAWLRLLGANVVGFSLKPDTEPAHFNLIKNDYTSIIADINKASILKKALKTHKPNIVFHLAAQPLVRESYTNPVLTYQTNFIGTLNLYEAVRSTPSVKAVICITTDKVYQNREWERGYIENDNLGGHDPYSASKACVEILSDSYRKSFFSTGIPTEQDKIGLATLRAGNVIGGGDWANDRLFPDTMKAAADNKSVFIRNPNAIRPWQHVLEPLSAYLLLGQKLLTENTNRYAKAWNIGPDLEDCQPVKSVLEKVKKHWAKVDFQFEKDEKKLHEAHLLKLDTTLAKTELNWKPVWQLDKAIEKTVEWYKAFYESKQVLTLNHLETYIKDAQKANAIWTFSKGIHKE
jgi:CDP-glucose 4,6-dehydratase